MSFQEKKKGEKQMKKEEKSSWKFHSLILFDLRIRRK